MFRFCYLISLIKLHLDLSRFPSNNRFSNSLIPLFSLFICSLSPFPCSFSNSLTSSLYAQRSRTKIKDSKGKRARPQRPAPPSQFSSLSPRLLVLIMLGLEKKKSKG